MVIEPESLVCAYGGCLHCVGEDVSERVPAQFRVIVTCPPKHARRACPDGAVQAPAPARLIRAGRRAFLQIYRSATSRCLPLAVDGQMGEDDHRFPRQIIFHAVWLYFRFPLSPRLDEQLLLERGIVVSYGTIRRWGTNSGRLMPGRCVKRSRRGRTSGIWTRS